MEIGVSILMSASRRFHAIGSRAARGRRGKCPHWSAATPESVGRRLVRADFCHVKTCIGWRLSEPQWPKGFKRGSRRTGNQDRRGRLGGP